jgi:hypothetical protein
MHLRFVLPYSSSVHSFQHVFFSARDLGDWFFHPERDFPVNDACAVVALLGNGLN